MLLSEFYEYIWQKGSVLDPKWDSQTITLLSTLIKTQQMRAVQNGPRTPKDTGTLESH